MVVANTTRRRGVGGVILKDRSANLLLAPRRRMNKALQDAAEVAAEGVASAPRIVIGTFAKA